MCYQETSGTNYLVTRSCQKKRGLTRFQLDICLKIHGILDFASSLRQTLGNAFEINR
ncbi:hypothetical protein BsWGS_02967 [Bradybaena similaris]